MATEARHQTDTIEQLQQSAADHEFFQLVRLAERFVAEDEGSNIQFKVAPKLSFPVAEISALDIDGKDKNTQLKVYVHFMGLVGHSGALPEHYTEHLLTRIQNKDNTLLHFLDLFHDQLLHLFYKIGSLSHFYVGYEKNKSHVLSDTLGALSGQSDAALSEAKLYYAGLLGMQSRSAESLRLMLQSHFQLPITIYQYGSEWLRLRSDEITHVSKFSHNNTLGRSATLGKRAWHVQNRISVVIGPVDYDVFLRLLPEGDMLPSFAQFVKAYCGLEYDFEIRLLLKARDLPACTISKNKSMKLGWTTKFATKSANEDSVRVKISANKLKQVVASDI